MPELWELFVERVNRIMLRAAVWAAHLRINWLANKNEKLAAKLEKQRGVVQLITEDGGFANCLEVINGRLNLKQSVHQAPGVTINIGSATLLMKAAVKKDTNRVMKAFQDKDISVQGDFMMLYSFMSIVKKAFLPTKKK